IFATVMLSLVTVQNCRSHVCAGPSAAGASARTPAPGWSCCARDVASCVPGLKRSALVLKEKELKKIRRGNVRPRSLPFWQSRAAGCHRGTNISAAASSGIVAFRSAKAALVTYFRGAKGNDGAGSGSDKNPDGGHSG